MLTLPTHIDKADIKAFIDHVTGEVMDGQVDPLSVHIRCKAVIKALEAILEQTEELAKEAAATYGRGEFSFQGASVSLREPRDYPDFSKDEVSQQLAERLKRRQDLLKTAFKVANQAAIVDPETGEIVPVLPVKPAKTTLTVTFK